MPRTGPIAKKLIQAAEQLRDEVDRLSFGDPVTHVYNPLDYAWDAHRSYLERFGDSEKRVVFLGMNPGPWGMAQIGVPFGEIALVREWIGIEAEIGKPDPEHPKRPIEGFACQRSEVSGRRLWGFFKEQFGTPDKFFAEHLVLNYCPLVFMEESGRNHTPDKLPAAEKAPLKEACDRHLRTVLEILNPEWAIGVGKYAESCLHNIAPNGPQIGTILHPSPASPAANRGWAEAATKQLHKMRIWTNDSP
jgi:single-strand selective monofunctional uracil DNA glycosylase